MYKLFYSVILVMLLLISCQKPKDNFEVILPSPNGQLHLHFNLYDGEPYYLVYLDDEIVISWSLLGLVNGDTESLQEKMLFSEVRQYTGNVDEQWLKEQGNYNSLKVGLQKQNDQNLTYEVVFLIYNESIVLWYEIDQELTILKPKLKENTEFDLSTKDKSWQLSDGSPIVDTMSLPLYLVSDKNIGLSISEILNEGDSGFLLQREKNIPEFSYTKEIMAKPGNAGSQPSLVKTTKKIIHINRSN